MSHRSVVLCVWLSLLGAVFGLGQAAAQPVPPSLSFVDDYGRVTDHYVSRETVRLRVTAAERNDPLQKDSFPVHLTAGGDSEDVQVQETGFDTGVFVGEIWTHPYYGTSPSDGTLTTNTGTQIQASYFQLYQPDPIVAVATVRRGVALFVDAQGRPAEIYLEGSHAYVRVKDRSVAFDDIRIDHMQVQVSAGISGDSETVALTETGEDTGVMEGSIQLRLDFAQPGDGVLQTREAIGPPAAFDTLTVSYNSPDGPVTASVGLIGSRIWFIDAFGNLADSYAAGSAVRVRVEDQNANRPGLFDQVQVRVINLQNGDEEFFSIMETTKDGGIFEGSLPIEDSSSSSTGDSRLQAVAGDAIEVRHSEGMGFTESADQAQIDSLAISFIDEEGRTTDELLESGTGRVRVFSRGDNANAGSIDQLSVTVQSLYGGGDHEQVQLTETGPDTSVFEGSFRLTIGSYTPGDNKLMTANSGPPEYRADQVTATYGPYSAVAHMIGARVFFLDAYGRVTDHYVPREVVRVRVVDQNRNNPLEKDSFPVRVNSGGDSEDVYVQETGFDTGVFEGSIGTHEYYGTSSNDGTLTTYAGSQIQATHFQLYLPDPVVAQATVRGGVLLFVDSQGRPAETYLEGSRAYVRVMDRTVAFDSIRIDSMQVQISAGISGDVETLNLTETGEDTGVLEGSIPLRLDFAHPGDGILETWEAPGPPHERDTITASYNRPDGPVSGSITLTGSRTVFIDAFGNPAETYAAGSRVYVRVEDQNANRAGLFDQALVVLRGLSGSDEELLYLQETSKDSGIFEGSMELDENSPPSGGDGRLQAWSGELIDAIHNDGIGLTASGDRAQIDTLSVVFIDEAGKATGELLESGTGRVRVFSRGDNFNPGSIDQLSVTVRSLYGADQEQVQLTETGASTSVFEGSFRLTVNPSNPGDNKLKTANGGPPAYLADQVTASYGPYSAVAHMIGARVYFLDAYGRVTDHYVPRQDIRLRVVDQNRNDPFQKDSFPVRVNAGGDSEDVYVQETGFDTGVFEGSIGSHEYYGTSSHDGTLTTYAGAQIQATHFQLYLPDPVVAQATVRGGVLLFVDAQGRPAETYLEGSRAYVRVMDRTVAFDSIRIDSMQVQISAGISGDVETLTLTETGEDTGVLEGSIRLRLDFAQPGNGTLETRENPGPPHEFDTLTASYNRPGGPVSASIGLIGSRTLFIDAFGNPAETYASGSRAYVRVENQSANRLGLFDQVLVFLRGLQGGDEELVYLQETNKDSGIFEGSLALDADSPVSTGDGRLQALPGELIDAIHNDGIGLTASGDRAQIDTLSVIFIDEAGKATDELLESGTGRVRVFSRGDNFNAGTIDQLSVTVRSLYGTDQEPVQLTETGANTSVFEGSFRLTVNPSNPGDNQLKTSNGGPPAYQADQVTASYGPYSATAHMIGARVYFLDAYGQVTDHYLPRDTVRVRVVDQNRNNPQQKDSFLVRLIAGDFEDMMVEETGFDTGVFEGSIGTHEYYGTNFNDGLLTTYAGTQIQVTHFQLYLPDPVVAYATVRGGELLFVDAQGRPAEAYLEGSRAYVRVRDRSVAFDDIRIDTMQVQISAGISGDVETLTLTETGVETGVMEGSIKLRTDFAQPGNGTLETRENPGPPHEFDTITASYNRPGGPISASIGLLGSETVFIDAFGNPTETYASGSKVHVRVEDQNFNTPGVYNNVWVTLRGLQGGDEEQVQLQETGKDSGIFEGSLDLDDRSPVAQGDNRLQAAPGETIEAVHTDGIGLTGSGDRARIDFLSVIFIDEAGQLTDELLESGTGHVRVFSRNDNSNDLTVDQLWVTLRSLYSADQEQVQLTETGPATSVFEGSFRLATGFGSQGNNKLETGNSGPPEYRAEQVTASYGPFSATAHTIGARLSFLDTFGRVTDHYVPRENVRVRVVDHNRNSPVQIDSFPVRLNSSGDFEDVMVQETGYDTGIFEGQIGTHDFYGSSSYDGTLRTYVGGQIEATHFQLYLPEPVVARATINGGALLFVDAAGRPADVYLEGSRAYVRVMDHSVAFDDLRTDSMQVQISAGISGDVETLTLTETGVDTGVMEGSIALKSNFAQPGNGVLETRQSNGPPHEFDTLTASYNRPGGPVSASIGLIGSRTWFIDAFGNLTDSFARGSTAYFRVEDQNYNQPGNQDFVWVTVRNLIQGDEEQVQVHEVGTDSGLFEGSIALDDQLPLSPGDGRLQAAAGEEIEVVHNDGFGSTTSSDRATIDHISLAFVDEAGRPTRELLEAGTGRIQVFSRGDNLNPANAEQMSVAVQSRYGFDSEQVQLTETGPDTSVFEGVFSLATGFGNPGNNKLETLNSGPPEYRPDEVTAIHGPRTATATLTSARLAFINQRGQTVTTYSLGSWIRVRVEEPVRSDPFTLDTLHVNVRSSFDTESVQLTETGLATGIFEGEILSVESFSSSGDGTLWAFPQSTLEIEHFPYTSPQSLKATAVFTGNRVPTASPDHAETIQGQAVTIPVLANDLDPEGAVLTVYSVVQGGNGTVVINPDGTVTYTPRASFVGTDTFTYLALDGQEGETLGWVTIVVNPANAAPTASDASFSVNENSPNGTVVGTVIATDPDAGQTLTYEITAGNLGGTFVIHSASGQISVVRPLDFEEAASFTLTVTVTDSATPALSDTATITINVTNVNEAPVANDATFSAAESSANGTAVGTVTATDADTGQALSYAITAGNAGGAFAINTSTGAITVANSAAVDFETTPTFTLTVTVTDNGTPALSDTATVTINVTNANDAPDAVNDATTVAEDGSVAVAVLANDSDPDGDTLTVASVTQGTNGSVVINPDKTVTYTPNANFNGNDSFTYTIGDGNGGTDTATVAVNVTTGNDAPVAVNDSATVAEDGSGNIAVLANDSDPDGDTLTVASVTQGTHGAVVINPDKTVTYTPNANFNGSDSFTYTVSDGNGGTETAAVTVVVTAVNDAPVAIGDSAGVAEDGSVAVAVLANDSDVDGDTLNVTSVTQGAHGTAVINPDKTVTYTPAANYNGPDSFTYTISDGNGGTASATVTVDVGSGNDAPVATSDSATVAEDSSVSIAVLVNDTDPDGDTLTVASVTQGSHGMVAINPNKTVTYTPNANFNGSDSFNYTVSDGNGGTETAAVTVVVTAVNDAPVAIGDSAGVAEDGSVAVAVLANDSDLDGDTLNVTSVTQGAHGSAVINPNKTVTYTPAANYNGPDSFTYTISDGNGGTASATVTVDVGAGNDSPVAVSDAATTAEDSAVNIAVLANDSDPDGDTLNVTAVTQGTRGTVTINPDKTVRYTPNANANGTDSFTYTVSDGNGGTATAGVTVIINPVNDAPVAVNDSATTMARTAVIVSVLANDSDLDGPSLSVASVTQPASGSAAINANGTVTYTPAPFFVGTDGFTYTIADGAGGTATANVTVTVARPNRVASNLQVLYNFDEGSGTTVNDVSGVGTPLNMTIGTPSAVSWVPGALSVNNTTIIGTAGNATKVINASKASNEVTIEAWVLPANLTQTGPARIVTLSQKDNKRDFTLGQSGNRLDNRVRTATSGMSGASQLTPVNSLSTNLVHVVFTRNSAGTAVTYLDGVAAATSTISGNFSTWDNFQLGVANELTGGGLWRGQLHLVAVYSRALTSDEVIQNLLASASGN